MVDDRGIGQRIVDSLIIVGCLIVFVILALLIVIGVLMLATWVLGAANDGQTWAHVVIGCVAALIVLYLIVGGALAG